MSVHKRLAIITTHPIQYNAPLFKLLSQRNNLQVKVFYTWGQSVLQNKYDPGFKKIIEWDIPLLEGYEYEFVENTAKEKGSHHFNGIINPGLTAAIEAYNADIILVYGWAHRSHLNALRYFKNKIPVLFRGDSTLLDDKAGLKKTLRHLFLKYVYTNVNYAFYAGKYNYDYFKAMGLKDKQLVFAPHAVENERFAKKNSQIVLFNGIPQLHNDHFVFLFAGKLESKKGVQFLIEAFLHAGFDATVHLIITGNGPLEESLKEKAGGAVNIHFLDFQNQEKMPALYQLSDVFILPSQGPGETWGLAVNEAMAAGKPVIVSNKCGCSADLIVKEKTGFIFQSGNVHELCSYLQWCNNNRVVLKQMGGFANQKITEYNFTAIATAIESLATKQSL